MVKNLKRIKKAEELDTRILEIRKDIEILIRTINYHPIIAGQYIFFHYLYTLQDFIKSLDYLFTRKKYK